MPLVKITGNFAGGDGGASIVDRDGGDGFGKKKSLRHVPLLVLDIGTADE